MDANRSAWGVRIAGAVLALGGAYGMWSGWDQIQLERGWSQFIAGATALSAGVVTMALGAVVAALGRLAAPRDAASPVSSPRSARQREAPREPAPPVEVDRYVSGEATYVMYSDGSVDMQTYEGSRRYQSLAALRADVGDGI